MDDEQLLRTVDRASPTWLAVVEWARAKKDQCKTDLLMRTNSRDDDMYYRGGANAYENLLRLARVIEEDRP